MFNFKEFIGTLLLVAIFCFLIFGCAQKEDELVSKHCSGLSGYEYGQCQASIY